MNQTLHPPLPRGFSFAGVHAGIKPRRKDLALILSDVPCAAAGRFTANTAKAAPVRDAERRLPAADARCVVVNSGNANALTGSAGARDNRAMLDATAAALALEPSSVFAASTGVIGVPLPIGLIQAAIPSLASSLGPDPTTAAEGILTTDTKIKTAAATLELDGEEVRLFAICKGSGMIAPQLATMIAVIVTDAAISPALLDRALGEATDETFNALTVDGDMSTNDAVFALANGLAGNAPILEGSQAYDAFTQALRDLCRDLAKQIARDGEGATKMVEVRVEGAPTKALAMDLSKSIAGSSLVKAALFGCDPNWGRILATVGARAGALGVPLDPAPAEVVIQGIPVYQGGPRPVSPQLATRMRAPEIVVEVSLHAGEAEAMAWGCDLSYDYVKINADHAALLVQTPSGGVAKDDRLTKYSAGFKVSLLLQALSYIRRFSGSRCVVHVGGAAIRKGPELASVANDLLLLQSVGLAPIVVHGGEAIATNRALVSLLNQEGGDAVGVSGQDGALLRSLPLAAGDSSGQQALEMNHDFLELLVARRYLPVIAPLGIGTRGESEALAGDRVAAEVAISTKAQKLVFLTDVPGILVGGDLVPELSAAQLASLLEEGALTEGMREKAHGILGALSAGVEQVHVIDGRVRHGIISELFTDKGVGTLISRG